MKVEQVYEIVNGATKQFIGEDDVLEKDLSNVVDVGDSLFNIDDSRLVENYTKELINHIGKVKFANRVYRGIELDVMMDGWEFGSILEKIRMDSLEATENKSWMLEDGKSYPNDTFKQPKTHSKFFNDRVTYEVTISITTMQVKESFSSAEQLNSFVSMIYNKIEEAMTKRVDSLILDTINRMTASTIHSSLGAEPTEGDTHIRAVNLLELYRQEIDETLVSKDEAMKTPEFLRFASTIIKLYQSRLQTASKLYNETGAEKFTPKDNQKLILLDLFRLNADVYLQADTYHNNHTQLPESQTVSFWQGSGTNYSFDEVSSINVKFDKDKQVEMDGIIGVLFDDEALGVNNPDYRTYSEFITAGEFTNVTYKYDAQYFNDVDENFVVFFIK